MTMDSFLKILGRNIMRMRKARGFTQHEAASRAQISYRYFQKIESGSANVTMATLYRLVKLFDAHIHDLLCHDPS